MTNCLKALNEASRVEVNPSIRGALQEAAGRLKHAIRELGKDASVRHAIEFNNAWALARRTLATATPHGDPTPHGGTMREERLAA